MAKIRIDSIEHEFEGTILDYMLSIGKNPDSYIFTVNGKPIPMDSVPKGDVLAINVASRG